jgi:hypothetical protein
MYGGVLLAAWVSVPAFAGVTNSFGSGSSSLAGGGEATGSGLGGGSNQARGGGGGSSVLDGDTASFSIMMYGSKGTVRSINLPGHTSVARGAGFADIGENRNGFVLGGGKGRVMAAWEEFVGASFNTITMVLKTSDGQDFFPSGLVNVEDPAPVKETFSLWAWNVGITDAVTWRNGIAAAPLLGAEYKLSTDGGQTFIASKQITNLTNPWNGRDPGTTQVSAGVNVNYIQLTYRVGPVPTPGALGLAGLCTLAAAHRRRR